MITQPPSYPDIKAFWEEYLKLKDLGRGRFHKTSHKYRAQDLQLVFRVQPYHDSTLKLRCSMTTGLPPYPDMKAF